MTTPDNIDQAVEEAKAAAEDLFHAPGWSQADSVEGWKSLMNECEQWIQIIKSEMR